MEELLVHFSLKGTLIGILLEIMRDEKFIDPTEKPGRLYEYLGEMNTLVKALYTLWMRTLKEYEEEEKEREKRKKKNFRLSGSLAKSSAPEREFLKLEREMHAIFLEEQSAEEKIDLIRRMMWLSIKEQFKLRWPPSDLSRYVKLGTGFRLYRNLVAIYGHLEYHKMKNIKK